jgi:regulatory protein
VGNYQQELEKARAYAFLLLKFRPRSELELSQRLKRKKFSQEIVFKSIAFLKEKKFLDDDCFARNWINSRIKKPLGLRRLRKELISK